MPAGSQHKQRSLGYMQLKQCRVIAVEPSQNLGVRKIFDFDLTMFPEVNFGEVSETGIGERCQERMFEFNPVEHGIRIDLGFLRLDAFNLCKSCDCFGSIRGLHYQQYGPAGFEVSPNRIDTSRRDSIGGND